VNAGELDTSLSDAIGALASSLLVLGVLWTFCWWLYRRKVFIRI
jgi:hypothetical protein